MESIGGVTDESPMAHKNIYEAMEAQKALVNILAKFYPKIVPIEREKMLGVQYSGFGV